MWGGKFGAGLIPMLWCPGPYLCTADHWLLALESEKTEIKCLIFNYMNPFGVKTISLLVSHTNNDQAP